MRAVVVERFGAPEVLTEAEVPAPVPGPDEVLVRVAACGVCGHDVLARQGKLGTPLPAVLGHEIAGVVEEAGPQVGTLRPGDRVALVQRLPCGSCPDCRAGATNTCRQGRGFYGEDLPGGYAEHVVAGERNAVALPDGLDLTTAAILSCAVGTGLRALRAARVAAGDVVVVTGAGGGVGLHAVQLAHHQGVRVVALTSSPDKVDALRRHGAAEVVVDATLPVLREVLAGLGRPRGADAVLEVAGPPTMPVTLRALRPRGRLVLVGNTAPAAIGLDPGLVIVKELQVLGSSHATLRDLEEVVGLVAGGHVAPAPAARFALGDAAEAHRALEARRVAGRAVLVPAGGGS